MKHLKSKKNEGFSYVEVLVSLAIILIIGVLLSFCYSTSFKNLIKAKQNASNSYTLFQFDTFLRKNINQISLPNWEKDYKSEYTSSSISFKWMNGDKNIQTLKIQDSITINSIETLYYSNNLPGGISVSYSYNNLKYECNAFFSSIPYGVDKL